MNPNLPSATTQRRPLAGTASTPHEKLIAAVDSFPETNGAGIILIDAHGIKTENRGGPRRRWVWIAPKGYTPSHDAVATNETPAPTGFWDRWGNSVLSCSSAVTSGVVITLSGGTATLVVGAFAVNSALLCGTSLGRAIADDAWQEFERNGGALYRTWLTTETLLSLIDLCNGVKGSVTAIKAWKQAGKLAKLEQAVAGKKLTRANLLKAIREIDPAFEANLKKGGAHYVSKAKLLGVSERVLQKAQFINLNNQRARVITDTLGNAMTLAGSPDAMRGARHTWDAWIIALQ